MLELACMQLQKSSSDNEILARTWAIELDKLDPVQHLFAQRSINDILFEAHLKTLHRNSITIKHKCVFSYFNTSFFTGYTNTNLFTKKFKFIINRFNTNSSRSSKHDNIQWTSFRNTVFKLNKYLYFLLLLKFVWILFFKK